MRFKLYAKKIRKTAYSADERTKRIFTVAAAAYLGRFGQGIAVLITLPIAKQGLHPELFGVWMMLSALSGFMAFADLGIGNGVLNNTTKANAAGNKLLLRQTLVGGYVVTILVGCLLLLAWFVWIWISSDPTSLAGTISPENRPQVQKTLAIYVCMFAINIPASLIQRVQLGMQQGHLNGFNQLSCAVLTIILVPLVLWLGASVSELVMATLGVQVLVNIVNTIAWHHRQRLFDSNSLLQSVNVSTACLLLRTGGMFFLLQLAAAFAFQSDVIVITQTLGQVVYGDFAVVQKLFLFISMVLSAAMVGLWPAFGDAIETKNFNWARTVLLRGMVVVAVISCIAVGALSVAMPWILSNWMSAVVHPGWGLVMALSAWTVIDATSGVFAAFMNGANILRMQLIFALGMALAAFGAKWLLTPALGPMGAVLSTIGAYCLISIPGQIYIFKQVFQAKG